MCRYCKMLKETKPDLKHGALLDFYWHTKDQIERTKDMCEHFKGLVLKVIFPMPEIEDLKYTKSFGTVNQKPEGEWIQVFVSDWNKDYWAYYAFISLDSYADDIKKIGQMTKALNWRDGDTYVELIEHTPGLKAFYSKVYHEGTFSHSDILDPETWGKKRAEAIFEKAQFRFQEQFGVQVMSCGGYEELDGDQWRFTADVEINGLIESKVSGLVITIGGTFYGVQLDSENPVSCSFSMSINGTLVGNCESIQSWYNLEKDEWDYLEWGTF